MTSTTLPLFNANNQRIGTLGLQQAEGSIDKPALIFIHGVGLQSSAWDAQVQYFCGTYRVYAIDMPGHGFSTPILSSSIDKEGNITDYVKWLIHVFHTLKIKQATLVGHSMGALISLGFATTYPEKVQQVALFNSVFCRSKTVRAEVIQRANSIEDDGIDIETPLQRWFDDSPEQQAISKTVKTWLSSIQPQSYAQAYKAFANSDDIYATGLAELTCPLIAITGSDDPNSTPAMSQQIAKQAINGQALIINNHRHMLPMTAADQVNELLWHWLQIPT